jgi:predicted alpha-1,2-mannosidase
MGSVRSRFDRRRSWRARLQILGASLAVVLPLGASAAATPPFGADPVGLVDPFIGTGGNGHTFPGAAVPFGMVQFSPVTSDGGAAGYDYSSARLSGFSLTRLSGSGCTNYGDVPLMPTSGPPQSSPARNRWAFTSGFSHREESAHPGSYEVALASGISVALTATTRTGLGTFSYPPGIHHGTILIDPSGSANPRDATIRVVGHTRLAGSATSRAFGGACGHPPGQYTVYFAIAFDRQFSLFGSWSGSRLTPGRRQQAGPQVGAYVTFDTRSAGLVGAKVGISFVSAANAFRNLVAEGTSWSFTAVRARAQARWNELLRRIRVSGGSYAQETVFYTALYHTLLHPNVFSDVNGQYSGEDGRVHVTDGYTQYTNFSGWDIYRGEEQLLALLAPKATSNMIRSLVADAEQTGHLPRWPVANAETDMMVGDPADMIIADAYAFGARGFDARVALRQMLAGAGVLTGSRAQPSAPTATANGERPGLAAYLARGYTPMAAATTLEYAIADFAISQFAGALGDHVDQRLLLARSANWKQTFNASSGFVEPRRSDGTFPRHLKPTSTMGFVEGNAWQYTFMVPQDMSGLLGAIGSSSKARGRLDSFFARLNSGPTAPHAWLGNEPSLTAPYAYLWLRSPDRSEAVIRRALTSLFTSSPGGLPGNDDLGTLSAWYVWSALGLYPVIPAVPGVAIIAPLFPEETITVANGSVLQIGESGAGDADQYVRSVELNGRRYESTWLPLPRIASGGRLDYSLGSTPSAWGTGPGEIPPSFTTSNTR